MARTGSPPEPIDRGCCGALSGRRFLWAASGGREWNTMLSELDPRKVCFLIVKLREFGVQAEPNLGGGSDATDDKFVAVFVNEANPSVVNEAEGLIHAMNVEEQQELIALSLVGRGDYFKEDWTGAMRAAASHPEPTTSAFLLQNPTVSDALEEGLSLFGFSCSDFATDRL